MRSRVPSPQFPHIHIHCAEGFLLNSNLFEFARLKHMSMNTFVLPGLDFVLESQTHYGFFWFLWASIKIRSLGESELFRILGILQVEKFGLFSVSRKNQRAE